MLGSRGIIELLDIGRPSGFRDPTGQLCRGMVQW